MIGRAQEENTKTENSGVTSRVLTVTHTETYSTKVKQTGGSFSGVL